MTIGPILTGGLGNGTFDSTIALLLTEGLGAGAPVVVVPALTPAAGGFDVESFRAATKAEKRRLKQYRKAQDELDRLLREAIEGEPEAAAAAAEAPQEAIAQAEAVLPEVQASDPRLAADMMQAIIALQQIMETLEAMQIQRAAIDDDEAMFILMMAA